MSKVERHFGAILSLVAGGATLKGAVASRPEFPPMATFKDYVRNPRFPERQAMLRAAQDQGNKRYYNEEDFDHSLAIVAGSDVSIELVPVV